MLPLLLLSTSAPAAPSCSSTTSGTWCTWDDGVRLVLRPDGMPTWPILDAGLVPGASVTRTDVRCAVDPSGRTSCRAGSAEDPSGREEVFRSRLRECFEVTVVPPGSTVPLAEARFRDVMADPESVYTPAHVLGTRWMQAMPPVEVPAFIVLHTVVQTPGEVAGTSMNATGPGGWSTRPDRALPEVFPQAHTPVPWVELYLDDRALLRNVPPGTDTRGEPWLRSRRDELERIDGSALPHPLRIGLLLDRLNVALRLRDLDEARRIAGLLDPDPDLARLLHLDLRMEPLGAVLAGQRVLDDPCHVDRAGEPGAVPR